MSVEVSIDRFDLVVFGAGPAGCAAAATAAAAGLRVALLDRETFPRDKICGDQVIINSLSVFSNAGIDISGLYDQAVVSEKLCFIAPSNSVEIGLSGSPVRSISCKRLLFDDYLFEQVRRRVSACYQGIANCAIADAAGSYRITFYQGGDERAIDASFIIGADGATSYIRRRFFPGLKMDRSIATREYCSCKTEKSRMTGYYYSEIEPGGYFWMFPVNETEANCGVIMFNDSWKKHFASLEEAHRHYVQMHNDQIRSISGEVNTWQLPLLVEKQMLSKENVLLAGDACGLINPMFGHGIDAAIYSGERAAICVKEKIGRSNFDMDRAYSEFVYEHFVQAYIRHKAFRDSGMTVDESFSVRLKKYIEDPRQVTAFIGGLPTQ